MREYILDIKKLIPNNVCKKTISYFDNKFEDAKTVAGLNKKTRNCMTRSLLEPSTFGEKLMLNYLKSKIFSAAEIYKDKFPYLAFEKISQLDILKYENNEHNVGYKFHKDFGTKTNERHISISICLNNEFEGGEFVFDIEPQLQLPQNVGDAVIFPSNFMFPHQVNPITSGTRYALIAWVI
jgi:predicted 2-oxoglutarate/Fe(II)-dependent dioxygenase YbiX